MSADYFILGGRDSRDFNVSLHQEGVLTIPLGIESNLTSSRITGRDGETVFDQYYSPLNIPLSCFTQRDLRNTEYFKKLTTWLFSKGDKELILSYEAYKYRVVRTNPSSFASDYGSQGFMFNFTCRAMNPFGYSRFTTKEIIDAGGISWDSGFYWDSGLLWANTYLTDYQATNISSGQIMTIMDIGTEGARPNIIFTGQATTLKVEHFSDVGLTNKINEFTYGAFNGTLEVNSLLSNTIKNSTVTDSIDTTVNYAGYITLIPTKEDIEVISGKLGSNNTKSTVELRTVSPSAVDDFYNDMKILIKCGIDTYERTITDYDGTTKIATLDSELPFIPNNTYDYSIANLNQGKNYFRITGTGFVNLDVLFDIRFVYN